ncbi:organic cation transporter 1 isoform X2 [Bicyclus anynana]|uniref:Organic cation transporter 1 isoform X2 n=1 Tax=Bicyclus anynana TaxID=110368 RepID=A0A6J1MV28_BICAN|nr:organic cation transporter 1 isoform X2 [Bicyclus anynana]
MQVLRADLKEFFGIKNFTNADNGTLLFLKIKDVILSSDAESRYEKIQRVQDAVVTARQEPTACTNWIFSTEHYKSTLVTEFSLVCDNEWLPRTGTTLFWVGSLVGNLFFGWISDRYGRRPTILLMIFLEVPLCILASFPGNYWGYITLRILGGLFFPALYQQPFILALELMPPATRTHTGIVVGMLFASGMCLLALLAFLIRDWVYLSMAISIPFVALFGYYWLIPESPRWLVGRGHIADAEKVLRNLAKKNGIILTHGFLLELHKKIKDEEAEAEFAIMPAENGQVPFQEREDVVDIIPNNTSFSKPESRQNTENDIENKENFEPRALEIGDLVKKSRSPGDVESLKEEVIRLNQKDSKKSQTECSFPKSLKRKSIQLVNKIKSLKENEGILEERKLDDQNSEEDCRASPFEMFRYPNIRKKFFILTFNWVALGVVYNSLSYNSPNLGVDDFLAFFIGGAVEIPSYFIAWQCMERYGRRWVLCIFMNIGGLACLCCALVPEAWPWVVVSLAMLGRLCAAASFAVFYVQIGELLPTVVRAQAMGASSVIAGIGLLTVPYIVALASISKYLPLIIMGVLSVMSGVTSLFLPETLNQPLPQTLEDGEVFGRNFKLLSCVERTKD